MADNLLNLDATDLVAALRRREVSALEVTELYLRRIEEHNPNVNAVREINPRALEFARQLDQQNPTGLLHGLPVLLKDNIDTEGELHTTAGAWNLRAHRAERDAPLVAQLRAAGAIVLGKANMTEWANFTTFGMPNGFSSLGGQVRNPWKDGADVGGSSSGSGAAVAARLAPIAVGTETSGSILSPASSNGVVGLKPTVGRVSRGGIIPIASSQDTAGPLSRTVRDAALLLSAMSAQDSHDQATHAAPPFEPDFSPDALAGARLGVARKAWDRLTPERRSALDDVLEVLRQAGAVIVEDSDLSTWDELQHGGLEVLVYEFKRDLNAYLGGVRNGPRSLREVISQNEAEGHMPYGQLLLLAAEATSGTLREGAYLRARARDLELARDRGLSALFSGLSLDAWLSPGAGASHVGAKAGFPSVCVPVGVVEGTPLALTLTGPAWAEPRLLSMAAAYETLRGPWEAGL
ncbi:amidase family protein [Deinococcus peraridilitoris]|uniref:Amidase, Asp-tRNAAsn/Glu-tRNAGln amidotransferase A subunit n=1 Tax=Deinococcus peraridilitoris (strain DSM 19664 / LMG 22246 / CIP 109416 / KR-200) TaxID=937777 RepID=L0A661_DEIPD|nr:amidase family protein [Deinococcus peraridilitoris]AFZ68939.1 amidase, Asp-tRNAAsn/Glu-tRNAGln amidotransferase A subunit [Deinococcus peraridilitoris DSM 19664]